MDVTFSASLGSFDSIVKFIFGFAAKFPNSLIIGGIVKVIINIGMQ